MGGVFPVHPSVSNLVYPDLHEGSADDLAARRYRRTIAQLLQQGDALCESADAAAAARRGGAA